MTDWLWKDISPELREKLKDKNGKPLKERKDFRGYVSAACPALELCRQIANGSKHGQFERNISAVISDSEGYDYGNPIIMEGDTQHRAYNVFYDALKWFEAFLRNEKVFPEELFVPKGD